MGQPEPSTLAAVPFHFWTPDVYQGSPTPVVLFMATSVKAAAFGAFIGAGNQLESLGHRGTRWWRIGPRFAPARRSKNC